MGMYNAVHSETRTVGVADALFGTVRQRVLGLLFAQPERSFYATEIIRQVAAGRGAVQRELARLSASGLLTVSRIGRQRHFRANEAAPIFGELRSIVLKTSGLADVLRAAMKPFRPEVRAAFVFGSIAKGESRADSDIDLMVISDRLTYAELFDALEAASAELARTISPTIYTAKEFERRSRERNPFLTKVLDQPRIWIVGEEHDLPA